MPVPFHVDPLAAEGDSLHLQAEPLFRACLESQLDFATRANHALPRQAIGQLRAKKTRDGAMVERIPGRGRHLSVGRDFAFRDGLNDPTECLIAQLVRPRGALQQTAFEIHIGTRGSDISDYGLQIFLISNRRK